VIPGRANLFALKEPEAKQKDVKGFVLSKADDYTLHIIFVREAASQSSQRVNMFRGFQIAL
jgi:hypothetical protein